MIVIVQEEPDRKGRVHLIDRHGALWSTEAGILYENPFP